MGSGAHSVQLLPVLQTQERRRQRRGVAWILEDETLPAGLHPFGGAVAPRGEDGETARQGLQHDQRTVVGEGGMHQRIAPAVERGQLVGGDGAEETDPAGQAQPPGQGLESAVRSAAGDGQLRLQSALSSRAQGAQQTVQTFQVKIVRHEEQPKPLGPRGRG